VPCLPDYEINLALAQTGSLWCMTLGAELIVSMLLVGLVGCAMMYLVYTGWDERMADQVQRAFSGNSTDL
jgi:uncharacterized membrane-anchored protein